MEQALHPESLAGRPVSPARSFSPPQSRSSSRTAGVRQGSSVAMLEGQHQDLEASTGTKPLVR